MKQIPIYFLILFFLGGCASESTKIQKNMESLSFIDMEAFDNDMNQAMSVDTKNIDVVLTGEVSINALPDRLGKWLSVVVDKQGRVDTKNIKSSPNEGENSEMTEKERTLGLSLLLGLLPKAYDFLTKEQSYGAAGDYNATIFYDGETGLVEKVVFTKK